MNENNETINNETINNDGKNRDKRRFAPEVVRLTPKTYLIKNAQLHRCDMNTDWTIYNKTAQFPRKGAYLDIRMMGKYDKEAFHTLTDEMTAKIKLMEHGRDPNTARIKNPIKQIGEDWKIELRCYGIPKLVKVKKVGDETLREFLNWDQSKIDQYFISGCYVNVVVNYYDFGKGMAFSFRDIQPLENGAGDGVPLFENTNLHYYEAAEPPAGTSDGDGVPF